MSMTTSQNGAPMPTRGLMKTIDAVRAGTGGGFDADAWHVMDQRDNALIADEIINGAGSSKFVYEFPMAGESTKPSGISVVGARHLANHYGGIRHRLIGSVQKIGALFTFTSFPAPGMPMNVSAQVIHELEDEEDFYGAIVEVTDIKTGNSVQMEKRENRYDIKRNGERYERAHYSTIAQSKAYRNGVLAIIPQDVQLRWKIEMLKLQKTEVITQDVMEEKRAGVLRFAASKGISVDRRAIEGLTMAQISGLSDAARNGLQDFTASARSMAVVAGAEQASEPVQTKTATEPKTSARQNTAPANARTEQTGQTDKQQQREAPKEEPKQTTAQTPNIGFSAYLYDEFGELLGDEYTNAMSYAQALKQARRGVDVVANFVEANADGIADARAANSTARSIIDEVLPSDEAEKPGETAQPGTGPGPLAPVPLTDNSRGTPAWPLYVKALKESLVTIGAINLDAWVEINLPRILHAPNAQRLQIIKGVTEHAAAVGGTVPAALSNAIASKPTDSVEVAPAVLDPNSDDRDMKWAIATVAEMNRLETADDVRAMGKALEVRNKMVRLAQEKKALFTTVDNAFRDAIAARSQPADASEDGIPTDDGDPGPSDYRA